MCVKLWIRPGLLIILLIYFNHNNAFRMKWTNLVCESFNKSWVVYRECRVRAISRNKTSLNAFVFVTEPAYNIFARAQMLKKANGYKPWLMDYTIDGCKFMRKKNHPFANIIWKLIKSVSTINHTCPYVGLNGIRNFYNFESLPIILPSGDYLLNITWLFDMKPQFITSVYFAFWDDS